MYYVHTYMACIERENVSNTYAGFVLVWMNSTAYILVLVNPRCKAGYYGSLAPSGSSTGGCL